MKFGAIIGNPPYQRADGGAQASAEPIYQNFVGISKNSTNRYVTMIMPSRWYAGGRGLDDFREEMLNDKHIVLLDDYLHPEEVFPNTNNRGGLCDFLWDYKMNNNNVVEVITHNGNNEIIKSTRNLKVNELDIFVRDSKGLNIIEKVVSKHNDNVMESYVSSLRPFGLRGYFIKDVNYKKNNNKNRTLILCYGKGKIIGYVDKKYINDNNDCIDKYKVFIPRANNIATELNDDNLNAFVGKPKEICTESYLVVGSSLNLNKNSAENIVLYMKTKFMRYMHSLAKTSQDATSKTFRFVPMQDFTNKSDIDWKKSIKEIDKQLYKKYKLSKDEIAIIENNIKPMK